VTFANYDWFSKWEQGRVGKRGADYQELKDKFKDLVWKQTVALFPQIKDCVEYIEVGTPITNKYYLRANKGEMYGLDHNKER
jgi:all-trans-retinol 13,14-reductase